MPLRGYVIWKWHVIPDTFCAMTLGRYSINTNIRNAIYFVDIPRYSKSCHLISTPNQISADFFSEWKWKVFVKSIKLLHKKSEYIIVSFEKCVVKFSSISRANYAKTKTDIAYSSVRSNITVERSVEGERKRGKKEKMFFPLFTFPSPLFFSLSFSPFLFSFLCFVNETIKRVVQTDLVSRPISFSSRERKLPVPLTRRSPFFARLKDIVVPTKRVADLSRQNCIIRVSCAKIAP